MWHGLGACPLVLNKLEPSTMARTQQVKSNYPETGQKPVYEVQDASGDAVYDIVPASSTIFLGDAHRILSRLPTASVRCVVTSPPYWSLRQL